ncbi:porin [Massilia horti]|uniref:Porin n=1 Tax=Massilia horti TaxID=2562153 RepID=A0A4Y9SYR4_9BURK|nr:porin [Massilia horti]TFW29763.1 porin [Massilia horti]
MKKSLLAALIGTCFATPVLAQSSVQIYGIADAGIMWQRGGPWKIISGGADGSRLGFKGVEEIMPGYKAVFNLEARVDVTTGRQQATILNDNQGFWLTNNMGATLPPAVLSAVQTTLQPKGAPVVNIENALFDRTALVGMYTPYGALLAGRMYTPDYEVLAGADTFEFGTAGSWGNLLSGTAGFTALGVDVRSQRALQYRLVLPQYGISGSLMAAAKGSGYFGLYNKFWGANLIYRAMGFDVGIGYNRGYDQNDTPSLSSTTIGGSYTWEDFKFFAGYHRQSNFHSVLLPMYINGFDTLIAPTLLSTVGPVTASTFRNAFINNVIPNSQVWGWSTQLGAQYRWGPFRFLGSVAYLKDQQAGNNALQFALGANYFLSKRTDLYGAVAWIDNRRHAQFSPGSAGSPGGFTSSPGEDGGAAQFGIRHKF